VKVSVCLITYNHEEYVDQSIDSVLAQATSFPFEIRIGEDGSTDRTREIVQSYGKRFPEKIRLNLQETNRGLLRNFLSTFESCRGEYVALLDGDDFWTDPSKLQKQADFLDQHPLHSICFHQTQVLLADGRLCDVDYTRPNDVRIDSIEGLFETNFIATSSAMLRRTAVPEIPEWYVTSPWEDWPLYLLFADRGGIGYLPEAMSVYRSHGRGLWSGLDRHAQLEAVIGFLLTMDERLGRRYTAEITRSVSKYVDELERLKSERAPQASAPAPR
jgi:glycosyltransferase involved in cell wall biosynthesis